jgi:hypothetical protein
VEEFWADSPESFDLVILGDILIPGICTVTFDVGVDLEQSKTKGTNLGTLKDQGKKLTPIDVEVQLVTRQNWIDWQKIVPRLNPRRADATRIPMQIVHADVNLMGITEVLVETIACGAASSLSGKVYTIHLIEYAEAPKAKKAATKKAVAANASPASTGGLVGKTPQELAYSPTGLDALERAGLGA